MNPNMNIPAQDPELVIPEGISLEPVNAATVLAEEQERANELHIKQRSRLWFALAVLLGLALFGVISTIIMKGEPVEKQSYQQFEATSIPLEGLSESSRASIGQISQAEINGTVTINGALVLTPSATPTNPVVGQIYIDKTTGTLFYYSGTEYQQVSTSTTVVSDINGYTGTLTTGSGLTLANGVLSANIPPGGVTSFNGQTGSVALTAGQGIVLNGSTISNVGVVSVDGATGALSLGRGIARSGNTLSNTISLVSSNPTLLSVTETVPGSYTIGLVGAGLSGTVSLGPVAAQVDTSSSPSIFINKTIPGDLLKFSYQGSDEFTVNQAGEITNGEISYGQVIGRPATTVTRIDTISGDVTLGTGLSLAGNQLNVDTGSLIGSYIEDGLTVQDANFNIRSKNQNQVTATISGANSQAANILNVKSTSAAVNPVFSISAAGVATFQPAVNNLSSFIVYNSDKSKVLLNADSINRRVGIGTNAPQYELDVAGNINASVGIKVGGQDVCTTSGCVTVNPLGGFLVNTPTLNQGNLAIYTAFLNQPTVRLQAASG